MMRHHYAPRCRRHNSVVGWSSHRPDNTLRKVGTNRAFLNRGKRALLLPATLEAYLRQRLLAQLLQFEQIEQQADSEHL